MNLGLALEGGAEFGGAGVEPAKLGRGDAAVEDVAQELVPEVDPADVARVIEVRPIHELLDRAIERRQRPIHDRGEDVRNEAAPDDRARLSDLERVRR